jgi:hypothetical protein
MNDYFGKSGSKLELLINSSNQTYVRKTSNNIRFVTQVTKQMNFKENDFFSVPRVFNFYKDSDSNYCCDMEYINGINPLLFVHNASRKDLDIFSKKVISHIDYELTSSQFIKLDKDIFQSKTNSLKIKEILRQSICRYLDRLFDKNILLYPHGPSHGDFTLSNMVFYDKIYLIDFLDPFVESPLQDIVKIRQDTRYNWAMNISNKECLDIDSVKVKINLKYIDNIINNHFCNYFWYKNLYEVFQILNLARIIPYIDDDNLISVLEKHINEIIGADE